MILRKQNGQTIVEAVVALAAIFTIVAAITVAIVSAVNNSQFIKHQNLANKYAQQGMEYVRRIQAEQIDQFAQYEGTYGYSDSGNGLEAESLSVNVGGSHIRNISFSTDEAPCNNTDSGGSTLSLKKVTVDVRWSSGKCGSDDRFCHSSTLVSCIPFERDASVFP